MTLPTTTPTTTTTTTTTTSSPFRHVDHILVAEFDIDKGSSLTFQYPTDTGADKQ